MMMMMMMLMLMLMLMLMMMMMMMMMISMHFYILITLNFFTCTYSGARTNLKMKRNGDGKKEHTINNYHGQQDC